MAINLGARSDKDNFTDVANLRQSEDSKPIYQAVMFLVHFEISFAAYALTIEYLKRKNITQ